MLKKLMGGSLACVTLLVSAGAYGQDLFTDVVREAVDEARLRQDYRALQRDVANGNTVGAQYDLMRIQQDRANLARDQIQIDYDLNRAGAPLQYPNYSNYPGYYNLNSAGQMLYFSPNQQFPPLQQSPQQLVPPANPLPFGAGVPANPVPGVMQTVRIANPESTGVTLSFVFGGKTYSVDSGRTEEFTVSAPTLIVFNRGGQLGVARYTLSGGNTFEFRFDNTGWLMVQKPPGQVATTTAAVPSNPVPRSATTPATAVPGPGPLVPQP